LLGYRKYIDQACQFILSGATSQGFLGKGDINGRRAHITALNFLIEYVSLTGKRELDELIVKGLKVTYGLGNIEGWEYTESSFDADMSTVGWYIQLLSSAHHAGYKVSFKYIDRARSWIVRATYGGDEGMLKTKEQIEDNMTRKGIAFMGRFFLNVKAKKKDLPKIGRTLKAYLAKEVDQDSEDINPFYLYFTSLGLFQSHTRDWTDFNIVLKDYMEKYAGTAFYKGKEKGNYWSAYNKRYSNYGDAFYTALNILTLQTCYRYRVLNG
jgi:hypothetical protein